MKINKTAKAKVLVCQHGSRHRYAVPALLEDAGLLAALYTDSCRYSPLGRMASSLCALGVRPRGVAALAARVPKNIGRKKIFFSDAVNLPKLLGGSPRLAPVFKRWGLQDANMVYSMYGEDLEFIDWAKSSGARIIVDIFVHPQTNRIVAEEELRVFGESQVSKIECEDAHSMRAFELADILLCPSEWVADGVRKFSPDFIHKIRVAPYGSSVELAKSINKPKPGRILFAGREPLRKGLHHLAEAAHLLRNSGVEVDVRVAGISRENIGWIKHRAELNCLGTIPMAQMKQEFGRADVFVLPSLSEGQAGVLLEAMACGVPVVSTRESGVDFEPGCGVSVPVGDVAALADSIKTIVLDRERRSRLAEGALRQASMFSMEEWQKRLVRVVEELG